MEKIKLSNSQEFNIIPMGIDTKGDIRYFKFISTLTHDEVLTIFTNSTNLASIDYIGADGIVIKTYLDCVKMLILSDVPNYVIDDNTTADIYVATISTSAVEMSLQALNSQMDDLSNMVVMISMT